MASIFTKIIKRELPAHIIWEDDNYIAFLDINPIQPGHTLVVPKQEVDHLFELDDETYTGLWLAAKKVGLMIKQATGAKRIGVAVEGFLVPHVHVHLIPINNHEEFNPAKSIEAADEDLKNMAEKIKQAA